MKKRHRRHTIARPVSALALISDSSSSDSEDDHQFDRISDILTNLIQEANEAVNDDNKDSIPLIRKLSVSSSVIDVKPKRVHRTNSARPVSYPSSSSLSVRRRSATPLNTIATTTTTMSTTTRKTGGTNALLESFKRLDSSLAIIDSLSRDLAPNEDMVTLQKSNRPMLLLPPSASKSTTQKRNRFKSMLLDTPFDARISALLLLPLLHVPHALISMVFDNMSSANNDHSSDTSSSLGGMVAWAFIFAITNLVVDKAVFVSSHKNSKTNASKSLNFTTAPINLKGHNDYKKQLPGTFTMDRQPQPQQFKNNNNRKRPNSSSHSRRVLHKRRGSKQQFYVQHPQEDLSQNVITLQDQNTCMHDNYSTTRNLLVRKSVLLRRNSL